MRFVSVLLKIARMPRRRRAGAVSKRYFIHVSLYVSINSHKADSIAKFFFLNFALTLRPFNFTHVSIHNQLFDTTVPRNIRWNSSAVSLFAPLETTRTRSINTTAGRQNTPHGESSLNRESILAPPHVYIINVSAAARETKLI